MMSMFWQHLLKQAMPLWQLNWNVSSGPSCTGWTGVIGLGSLYSLITGWPGADSGGGSRMSILMVNVLISTARCALRSVLRRIARHEP